MFYRPLNLQRWKPRPRAAPGMLTAATTAANPPISGALLRGKVREALLGSSYWPKGGAPQPATSGNRHVL